MPSVGPRARRRRLARRRALFRTAVVLLAIATLAVVLATRSPAPTTPTTTTTSPTTTTASAGGPPFAVGTLSLVVRETVAGGAGTRLLPTTVYFPTAGPTGGPVEPGAAPLRSRGPYPLVVFSEGYAIAPQAYGALLDAWAAAGYVVAAPIYPFTDPSAPGGLNESDIVRHPADLRFVISWLLHLDTTPGGDLSGLIRSDAIAVIGHSDGGDVSLATVANTCCTDPRISAAILLSGAELTSFGGTYFAGAPVPLLVVQGTADTINPPPCSIQIYDAAPEPKRYLSLFGESHTGAYLPPGPARSVVERVTVDFLNGYLKGSASALGRLTGDGTVPGVAAVTNAPSVSARLAPPAGTCPGAPPR